MLVWLDSEEDEAEEDEEGDSVSLFPPSSLCFLGAFVPFPASPAARMCSIAARNSLSAKIDKNWCKSLKILLHSSLDAGMP